jgi:hypothetical protein
MLFWNLLKQRQKSGKQEVTGLGIRKTASDWNNTEEVGVWTPVFRWTLPASLWNATNSFDFFQAWKEKPHWVISGFDYSEFLKNGSGDDLDEFARIFVTVSDILPQTNPTSHNGLFFWNRYFGVNEIKTFCLETARSHNPWTVY